MSQSLARRRPRISLASEAGDARSPWGWAASVSLHVLVLGAALFTWQHTLDIANESPPVVPVDLVTLGQKTNIAPTQREQPKPNPSPAILPPPAQLAPPPVANLTAQTPEMVPSEPLVKPPPPPAVPTPRTQPQQKKSDSDQFNALLNKLTTPQKTNPNAKTADRTIKGIGAQNAMTMDLVDTLRNEIAQCWSPPAAAPHPEKLIVTLRVFLNPDGSVAQAPQLTDESQAAVASNPFMRAAADAANRAIYVCQPYKLPPDRYAQWRDIEVTFDPRKMAGIE